MKVSAYRIDFLCAKCGSVVSMSGEKIYKDIELVLEKADDEKLCHVCGTRSITFSRLHADLAGKEDIPKIRYELAYRCEECGMTFRSDYWIKKGDVTPFKDPAAAGITCVGRQCKSSKIHLTYCKQISR